MRTMLTGKIHRATVTHADLDYVGSITIDSTLLAAADILPGEKVDVVDVTNGARIETYVIEGVADSGVVGVNGAAAHLVHPGDVVIVMAYGLMADAEARSHLPRVVHVDADNRIRSLSDDSGEPADNSTRRSPLSLAVHPASVS